MHPIECPIVPGRRQCPKNEEKYSSSPGYRRNIFISSIEYTKRPHHKFDIIVKHVKEYQMHRVHMDQEKEKWDGD